ncbi:prepilin-type N-terminal cleavage/methylation domain-containing protein [Acinetobacter junii]|uniref:pilus assembly FimT family protein n=1 Tax=Acinetobacter junii TaxID=40215 RepID=UPI000F7EACDE|nr:prepilin-type N-terminal cleavage/methylation domain-containing protein [Acinetobacter junii]MDA3506774.1 prepilin-type N-terminal cleavage/methylation domain-containing protein [Acinetobacter junii]MDA3531690.1 prepilin-type N-terminal cleavage/methylation domain-containing protein [Acinetobacter junii]RTE46272.1 prepilin-type N-terminal cleavage/methylation domain-containing protein [Acinetobacter junii]
MGKNRGFTLIELMVTIAVLAIIAMFAAPSFGNMLARKQLDTTARDLALILGEARGQAISLGKDITIILTCPTETDADSGESKVVCPANTATNLHWVSQQEDVELTSDAVDVVFSGLGTAKQREVEVDNPAYIPTKVSTKQDGTTIIGDTLSLPEPDKSLNPSKIPQAIPLEFTLCSSKLSESRIIKVSNIGVINQIEVGTC